MNSESNTPQTKEKALENTLSINEFFRQLEAKEKDLDISAEMIVEVDEASGERQDMSDFLQIDVSVAPNKAEPSAANFTPKPALKEPTPSSSSEVLTLQNQLKLIEAERGKLFEAARRRQNDFDNYKKRTERERGETFRNQLGTLANQMLPVVDNLNRALDSSNYLTIELNPDFKQFFEGIVMVSQQLNEILAEMGVQPISAVGEIFDPHYHEAVATEQNNQMPSHTITEELLRGYRIGEKVIRPSMVKVSTSGANDILSAPVSLVEKNS